jgi:hypothetical protein
MRVIAFFTLFTLSLISACSSNNSDQTVQSTVSVLGKLPATIDGVLTVDVAEGDVDEEGTSEFIFGTLTVGSEEIPIQISGSVLTSAGISEDGGKVTATLGSKSDEFGLTTYTVTSLQRM